MNLFKPKGERSLRDMVHDGIDKMPPLEPGTSITHDMISEWLGEPFPRMREFGDRAYEPMGQVRHDLLSRHGVWLLTVEGRGYKVATAAQMVAHAERKCLKNALDQFSLSVRLLEAARTDRLTPTETKLRDQLAESAQDHSRSLRNRLRTIHQELSKWRTDSDKIGAGDSTEDAA